MEKRTIETRMKRLERMIQFKLIDIENCEPLLERQSLEDDLLILQEEYHELMALCC